LQTGRAFGCICHVWPRWVFDIRLACNAKAGLKKRLKAGFARRAGRKRWRGLSGLLPFFA
jgi:hypothetical protein